MEEKCLTDLPVDVWQDVLSQIPQPALHSLRQASKELRNRVDAVTKIWSISSSDFSSGNSCDANITSRFPALHTLHFTAIGLSRRKPVPSVIPSSPPSLDLQSNPNTSSSQPSDQAASQDCYTDQDCADYYSEWGDQNAGSTNTDPNQQYDSIDDSSHSDGVSPQQQDQVTGSSTGKDSSANLAGSTLEASRALETLAAHVLKGLPSLRTVTLTLGDNAALSLPALSALTDACPHLESMTLPLSLGNSLHPQRSLIFGMQLNYTPQPTDITSLGTSESYKGQEHRSQSATVLIKGYSSSSSSSSSSRMGASCSNGSSSRVIIQTTHNTASKSARPSSTQPTSRASSKSNGSAVSDADDTLPPPPSDRRQEANLAELALQFKLSPAAAAIAADRRANRAYAAARLELLANASPPSQHTSKTHKAHAGPHLSTPANHPQRIPDLLHALPPGLKHLSLLSCDAAGASSLAHLSRFGQLRKLELHSLRLSDAKLAKLQSLASLTALTVVCPVSRQGNQGALRDVAASFGRLASSLVSLHLTNCSIASGYGHQLSVLQQLQRLECNTLVVGGAEMEALHKIPRLEHVSVLAFRGLQKSEERLRPLTALTSLQLEHALGSEREAEILFTGLPELKHLRWQGRASVLTGELTSEQLVQLTVLKKLEHLDLPVAIIYGQPRLERSLQDWVLSAWSHHAKWPLKVLHLSGGADVTEGAMVDFVLSKPTVEEITLSVFYQFGFQGLLSMATPAKVKRITLKSCMANNDDCANVMAALQRPGLSVTRLP